MEIVLARPHALLRNSVTAALQRCGLAPRIVNSAAEILQLQRSVVSGAIVSAAASSDVGASLPEMLERFREAQPNLPLVITTLMDADQVMAASLDKVIKDAYGACDLISMDAELQAAPCRQRPWHILVLTRRDLEVERDVDAVLQKHFSRS
ncbi:MAG TPA: hypothetical protein VNF68_01880 [Candidatus Baltobacteraceae bacterium]|nr:hypothetical protein [Candidatus Baltobacteraceae bacterium]